MLRASKTILICTLVGLAGIAGSAAGAGHDSLSCAECHVSHREMDNNMQGALWNLKNADDGLPVFQLYSSPSFDKLGTDISQPDGPSKICLGCHDGSYPSLSGKRSVFTTTSLAMSHPVSFTYDSSLSSRVANGGLQDPSITPSGLGGTIAQDLLDERGKLQCTSCHDVHASGKGSSMLRYDYTPGTASADAMCKVCHNR